MIKILYPRLTFKRQSFSNHSSQNAETIFKGNLVRKAKVRRYIRQNEFLDHVPNMNVKLVFPTYEP